jgi:parallel beta-helix repeat protein
MKEMKRNFAFCAVFALVFCGNGYATSYFSSPSGSMADSGTSVTSAWGKLQDVFSAGKAFLPGDTIYLMSGNHGYPVISAINTGDVVITGYKNSSPVLNCIDFNGASHWILENVKVFNPASPPKAPILEHPVYPLSDNTLLRIMNKSSYITLSNCYVFSIENSSPWTSDDWNYRAWNGVVVEGTCNNTTLKGCHVKNTNFALELSGSNYTTVVNTMVENFCGDGIIPGNNNIIEYNTFRDSYKTNGNHCDLVQGFSVTNLVFRGNKMIGRTPAHSSIATDCQGIGFFDGTFKNCLIENNLISVETYHGITIYNAINCIVINNTLIDMASGGLVPWMNITGSGNIIRNNISSSMNTIEGTADHNIVVLRSKYINYFVDPDNQDYHLKEGSPAINAGIDTNAPPTDLDKTERPRYLKTDVGAYEYYDGPDTIPPTMPMLLTVKNATPSGFTLSWSSSTDNVSISGYDIYVDGILDTTVNSNTVIYTSLEDSTTYSIKVIAKDDANNLSEESDPIQVTTLALVTGFENAPNNSGIALLYPNPVEGAVFYIRLDNWDNRFLTIEIADDTGKILMSQFVYAAIGNLTIKNIFKRGFYILRINDGRNSVCQKFLVQ